MAASCGNFSSTVTREALRLKAFIILTSRQCEIFIISYLASKCRFCDKQWAVMMWRKRAAFLASPKINNGRQKATISSYFIIIQRMLNWVLWGGIVRNEKWIKQNFKELIDGFTTVGSFYHGWLNFSIYTIAALIISKTTDYLKFLRKAPHSRLSAIIIFLSATYNKWKCSHYTRNYTEMDGVLCYLSDILYLKEKFATKNEIWCWRQSRILKKLLTFFHRDDEMSK